MEDYGQKDPELIRWARQIPGVEKLAEARIQILVDGSRGASILGLIGQPDIGESTHPKIDGHQCVNDRCERWKRMTVLRGPADAVPRPRRNWLGGRQNPRFDHFINELVAQ